MSSTQYLISDALWEKTEPLLPVHRTNHPLGTHRKRVDNRVAMNGILFVLRTGCQWNALNATGALHIVALKSGEMPVSLNDFGRMV
tara:strand:- start:176 stop:433 length:258 start_codon:yes stop_codon:yes gene_type:complete